MRSLVGSVLERLTNQAPVPYVAPRVLSNLFSTHGRAEQQLRAMGAVGTLFGIVNRTSTALSQVDWHLYRVRTDQRRRYGPNEDDRIEVTRHLALDVLNHPNEFTTRQELFEAGQQHIDLVGEGCTLITYLDQARTLPHELWTVRPDRITPVPHPTKFLAGYIYTGPDGEKIPLDLNEVIFIRMPNPLDPYRGMGPVQAVLTDLDASKYTAEWNRNFFINSAEPGGIIEVERRLDDTEFEELRMRWNEQHRGVANAHRVALVEQGKWVNNAFSQRDMQFTQLRTASRDTILEAFGMPKSMLGITESVNRANAETGEVTFGRWMTVPRLERWKSALNNDFLPKFGATGQGLEFDYENPVPESREEENADLTARTEAYKTLIDAHVDPVDAAVVAGLPPMQTVEIQAPPAPAPVPPSAPAALPSSEPQPAARAHLDITHSVVAVAGGGGSGGQPPSFFELGPRPLASTADSSSPAGDVDLGPVKRALDDKLEALLADWQGVTDDQVDEIIDQVEQTVGANNLAGLTAMTVNTDAAHTALLAAMTAIASQAADQVVDEADEQGVTIAPGQADDDQLSDHAQVLAGVLAAMLVSSAANEALRQAGRLATPTDVGDAVRTFLAGLTDARPRQYLGAGLHSAQHAGRVATMASAERDPGLAQSVAYYASEVNDTNTCGPCSQEDGRALGSTITDAEVDYPTGGYVDCEGGNRCRGHIVAVWTIGGDQ